MADSSSPLILEALTRAAAEPAGLPLLASKPGQGLFASTAPGKQAAQTCKEAGWLRVLRQENRGKTVLEICGLTETGLALLLDQANPKPLLQELVQALHDRQGMLRGVSDSVQRGLEQLDVLRERTLRVLERIELHQHIPPPAWEKNGANHVAEPDLGASIRAELASWADSGALDDCPLPELFRRLRPTFAQMTIGQFHDQLRLLHQARQLYLHPWTGPLYELPEPAFALLVGHEIAYYASPRAAEPA